MVKINSALLLYFAAVIFYVIAVMIGSDNLELFCKPIIIPSIYYFYYISVKGKANFLFTIFILLDKIFYYILKKRNIILVMFRFILYFYYYSIFYIMFYHL